VTRTVETGQAPYGISFDRKGERIFIATSKEKALQVFDAKTFEKSKTSALVTVAGTLALRQMISRFYLLAVNLKQ